MATAKKVVEVKDRKIPQKVLTFEDVRVAARAGNAALQKFVDTGTLATAK